MGSYKPPDAGAGTPAQILQESSSLCSSPPRHLSAPRRNSVLIVGYKAGAIFIWEVNNELLFLGGWRE